MKPTIYLLFNGNCLEAMTHYAKVLGGDVGAVFRNADVPDPQSRMPGGDDLVMHMSLKLGDDLIMASDTPSAMYDAPRGFSITLAPASRAEFERLYESLGKGAKAVAMAPGETFWAERFAMFTDRYGTPWMLNFEGSKAA
jgi:PhnB protein